MRPRRVAARYVEKVLRCAKAAKALGLAIAPGILIQATEVIR